MTRPTPASAGRMPGTMPPVALIFDVNETLIDITALAPTFERIFGDGAVMREWFAQVVTYSMTATLSGLYTDFFTIGQGVLRMLGAIHATDVSDDDTASLTAGMLTMPAHPDVLAGLNTLREHGYRLATLTNSPPNPHGATPLEHAGLSTMFERQLSVDTRQAFKPSVEVYHYAAAELGLAPAQCMMVAAHVWDTIGAQAAGLGAALITRPGNAPLVARGLPQPQLIATDIEHLAHMLTSPALGAHR